MFANGAENGQRAREQCAKDNELAALGFEKIEKGARFHGWSKGMGAGALVTVTTGGGERRVTKTLKALRRDNSLRPPSGVPLTAK
jgi:hypothetical protein